MKKTQRVWLNGRILPASRARIPVFDRGFLYGDAVFETVRIYAGRPFLWRQHLRRLHGSMARLGLARPAWDLQAAVIEYAQACKLAEGAVRITITRGVGEGLVPPPGIAPTVLMTSRPVPADLPERRTAGVGVIRLPFGNGGESVVTGHKTTGYAAAVQGRILADRAGAFEAIYVEADGNVSEATTSNVFAFFGNVLHTPPLAAGCLPGITRQVVLELARRAGIRVRETPLDAARLARASEIFLTGSVIEILPVVELDGAAVGRGTPGEHTASLSAAYGARVKRHVRTARARS